MPKVTTVGASNADAKREGDQLSAGTSSSTSDAKQEWSGSEPQGTDPSLLSPVQTAESLSDKGQPSRPVQSSSASTTDGSTQETGLSPLSPSASSEESRALTDPMKDQSASATDPKAEGTPAESLPPADS